MTSKRTRRAVLVSLGTASTAGCLDAILGERSNSTPTDSTATPTTRTTPDVPQDPVDVQAPPDGAWPMFAGDAENSGIATGRGPVDADIAWTFEAAGRLATSPVVADGIVIVGSQDRNVYAVSAADGSERWRFPLRRAAGGTLAVDGSAVYVGDGRGRLYALSVDSGERKWGSRLDEPYSPSNLTLGGGHLTLVDEMLYVADSGTGDLFRVDRRTGDVDDRLEVDHGVKKCPAIADGIVYVGWQRETETGTSSEGGLDAMTTSGDRLWRVEPGVISGSPTIVDDVVYAASTEASHAFDASTGEELWRFEAASSSGSPTVSDGLAFLGSMSSTFYAVDAATGEQVWEFTPGAWPNNAPVVADGVVYLTSGAKRVYGLDAATGEKRWRHQHSEFPGDPVVADETVYVTAKNTLLALRDQ